MAQQDWKIFELEEEIIEAAADPDALKHEDRFAIDVFRAVMEVAVEDRLIAGAEFKLLARLRKKLGIRYRTKPSRV